VFQEKVTLGAETERCDRGKAPEEALVIAVVGDAVCAGGVVVYEAEVELASCCGFGVTAEVVEAFWDGPWWVFRVVLVLLLD
jgi:hypothetical protein